MGHSRTIFFSKDKCTTVSGQILTHSWCRNTSYLFPRSSQPLQRRGTAGFNQCLKSVGRDNPKIPPELTELAGLGSLFVLKIRADSRRSRAPSDLSYWWKQSRVPTRVQFPRASYSRCACIGFNEKSSFDQLVTQERRSAQREGDSSEGETALRVS